MKPIRVLFVCLGNICRSPMAEFVMKKIVKEAGLEKEFLIESAATSDENIWNGHGAEVYPPAKAELKKHGISCEGKRAAQLQKSDYDKYDLFVCMDDSNVRNSKRIFGSDPDDKLCKLMDFTGSRANVADPWYTGDFSIAYSDIEKGCTALFEKLK